MFILRKRIGVFFLSQWNYHDLKIWGEGGRGTKKNGSQKKNLLLGYKKKFIPKGVKNLFF